MACGLESSMIRTLAIIAFLSGAVFADEPPARIVVFGDSLTAGYELPREDGFVPVLAAALSGRGFSVTVINASVAGNTSFDGLQRFNLMLRHDPEIVIVELGANDMLRGLPPTLLYDNLDAMIGRLIDDGIGVVLAGMLAPANMGEAYVAEFADVYQRLAKKYQLLFLPFFLDEVALNDSLNLSDGIHPNAAGVKVTVANILPLVVGALKDL